jgi:hypothetical protein
MSGNIHFDIIDAQTGITLACTKANTKEAARVFAAILFPTRWTMVLG